MQLRVLASGSRGNCYLLETESECLIVEIGIRFDIIKKALRFDLSKVVGALISHEHGDHAVGVKDALRAGIECYMSPGTARALRVEHHRVHHISKGERAKLGNFEVMAFDLQHDCEQPIGFLIRHPESGVTCFLTDTAYTRFVFPGLNNVIVEANYCPKILAVNEAAGLHPAQCHRVKTSHMSIDTCKAFLRENDLTDVVNILLIHLSDSNSDAARFQREVQEQTNKIVTIASPGTVVPWNSTPF